MLLSVTHPEKEKKQREQKVSQKFKRGGLQPLVVDLGKRVGPSLACPGEDMDWWTTQFSQVPSNKDASLPVARVMFI